MVGGLGELGMANSPAPALPLRVGDKDVLRSWTRSMAMRSGLVQRAKIVLLAAEGVPNAHIATEVGTTTTSVWKWRKRYAELG
ncbi:helix-turn-helix domain-containing protein, partial [Galactobacter sp.]|uniref:helix-turn-helix domain-containing protein n=1 Tax=Galactobacter sp. TaxID=2676125 RepID=UPI00345CB6E5